MDMEEKVKVLTDGLGFLARCALEVVDGGDVEALGVDGGVDEVQWDAAMSMAWSRSQWRPAVEGMCGWSASGGGDLRVAMAASICYTLG
jgi:hypothetical protein